jgi:hypothetical protein
VLKLGVTGHDQLGALLGAISVFWMTVAVVAGPLLHNSHPLQWIRVIAHNGEAPGSLLGDGYRRLVAFVVPECLALLLVIRGPSIWRGKPVRLRGPRILASRGDRSVMVEPPS